jgi:hypothetical protein
VGACSGCHATKPNAGGSALTRDATPTDVCLRCHLLKNGASWGFDPRTPGPNYGGGQFVFLLEDNLADGAAGADRDRPIPGDRAGHNVISIGQGTQSDPQYVTSPGGSYRADNLHCTSCHDPHGRGGHFRLLYGNDYPDAVVNGERFVYRYPAPVAEGIPLDGPAESDEHHTAYRSGMSAWCGNCHGMYHQEVGTAAMQHPSDQILGVEMANLYNAYLGTGRLEGQVTGAYTALAPVEFPESTIDFSGPVPANARVTCLTCHRAHASSAPRSGRWDFNIATWAEEGLASQSYPIRNPYEGTAGPAQRQLCEKCHATAATD